MRFTESSGLAENRVEMQIVKWTAEGVVKGIFVLSIP